jgi:UPF0716 protein FxsA
MLKRLFGLYVLIELAVVVALVYAIGFGWTVLLLLGTFALGIALAGSQMTRQLGRLRSGLAAPQDGATDSLLIALGTVLTVVPGLVSSALGLLLLAPPTRTLARPAVAAIAARGLARMPLVVTSTGPARAPRGDYIDGEVLDVTDVTDVRDDVIVIDAPQLPRPPA